MAVDVKDEEEKAAEEAAKAVSCSSSDSDSSSSDEDGGDGGRARNANEAAVDEARAAVLSNLVAPVQLSDEPPGEDEPVRFVFGFC